DLVLRGCVPENDLAIVICTGEPPSVRAIGHALRTCLVPFEPLQLSRFNVPDQHRLIGAAGGYVLAVGPIRHGIDPASESILASDNLSIRSIQDMDVESPGRYRQAFAVRTVTQAG